MSTFIAAAVCPRVFPRCRTLAYSCIIFLSNHYVCFGPSVIPCSRLGTAALCLSAVGPSVFTASTCGHAAPALEAGACGFVAPLYTDWRGDVMKEKVHTVLKSSGICAAVRNTRVQKVTMLEILCESCAIN